MNNSTDENFTIIPYKKEEANDYINVIRRAFQPVADHLEMTQEKFSASGAYMTLNDLTIFLNRGGQLFGLYDLSHGSVLIATIGISTKDNMKYKLEKLAVLPEYQHKGHGRSLMLFAEDYIRNLGGVKVSLGLVEEHQVLKTWYKQLSYVVKKTKPYKKSGFHITFMEKDIGVHKFKRKMMIWLMTHEREKGRPTNTGQLIKEMFPDVTTISYWSRVEADKKLLSIIENEAYQPILIFPIEGQEERRLDVSHLSVLTDRVPVYIILDGIWKESRKMLRQSPYLSNLPFIAFENLEKTRYTLRRNKEIDHICTAEVAIELLIKMGESAAAELLNQRFETFIEHY